MWPRDMQLPADHTATGPSSSSSRESHPCACLPTPRGHKCLSRASPPTFNGILALPSTSSTDTRFPESATKGGEAGHQERAWFVLLLDFLQATLVLCLGEGAGAYFNGRLCRACLEFVWSLQFGGSVLVGRRDALIGRTYSKEEHTVWQEVSASSVKVTKSRNTDGWGSRICWGAEIRNLLLAEGLGFPNGFVGKRICLHLLHRRRIQEKQANGFDP